MRDGAAKDPLCDSPHVVVLTATDCCRCPMIALLSLQLGGRAVRVVVVGAEGPRVRSWYSLEGRVLHQGL